MKFKYLDKIIFDQDASLKSVLERFNETAVHTEKSGFAIIVDKKDKCIGVVTDGDIRRKLVDGISIDKPVKLALNRNFVYITKNDSAHKALRQFDKNIYNLPVLDQDGRPVDLYQYSKFVASTHSESRIIRSRVPVRVSFSGGGTDMSSYINQTSAVVLSSTINKYCTASVKVRDDNEIHIRSRDLGLKYFANNIADIKFGDELDLIKAAIKIMEPDYGMELETFAEFEPGTGLGGSSAIVISVLGALNYFRNEQQLDIYQIADVAYQVERIDMQIYGGWQDHYAISFGGFSLIEFRQNEVIVNQLKLQRDILLELECNLMLFRLGKQRNSGHIQKKFIKDIKSNRKNLVYFSEMSQLTIQMKEALLKGELKKFGLLLHDSWTLKRKINNKVTNEMVEDCCNTAKSLGSLGGKLLGAGESGYLLLYASPIYQKQIKDALFEKGAVQETFKFSQEGLEVWSTKMGLYEC